ncbi:MAG: hypothetical protein OXE50_12590 [Chloroflexi bacterium]|nr:hypothetical protein [Chloroflexota bacterium]
MTRPSLGVDSAADRLVRMTSAVRAVPQARGVVRAFDALRPCYGETKRKARSVPGVPAEGAINFDRQTDAQRLKERPTPTGRRASDC